jgi:hypothetical protein
MGDGGKLHEALIAAQVRLDDLKLQHARAESEVSRLDYAIARQQNHLRYLEARIKNESRSA